MASTKYTPECYKDGNKVIKIETTRFVDRSRNVMYITTAFYLNKKGQEKEQVLKVEHLGKFIKQIHLDLELNE